MKYLLIALLFLATVCNAQDTTITDSTPLLNLKQIDRLDKYLEVNMKSIPDYKIVMSAVNALLQEAINERKKKKHK